MYKKINYIMDKKRIDIEYIIPKEDIISVYESVCDDICLDGALLRDF